MMRKNYKAGGCSCSLETNKPRRVQEGVSIKDRAERDVNNDDHPLI